MLFANLFFTFQIVEFDFIFIIFFSPIQKMFSIFSFSKHLFFNEVLNSTASFEIISASIF